VTPGFLARLASAARDRGAARDFDRSSRATASSSIASETPACCPSALSPTAYRPDAARRRHPLDLRKAEPYLVYDEIDFDVPVGTTGDNYDRFLVCQEELVQSIRIMRACMPVIEKTEGEPVNVTDPRIRWPGKERVFGRMEELIQQFKGVTEGIKVPAGEAYAAIESPNGELGFYVSDGTGKPYGSVRPPSFANVAPMREMLVGGMLADIVPTFDMINMIGGECDR
jgi:NADH-quinone oxidoreductase subunit D